jgi:hypothetical protein
MIRSLLVATIATVALAACYDGRPPPSGAYNPPGFVDRDGNGRDDRIERRERQGGYYGGQGGYQGGYGGGYQGGGYQGGGYQGGGYQGGYGGPGGYYGNQPPQGYYDRNGVWRSY